MWKLYAMLSCSNKQFPLFNGAAELNCKDYDIFLKTLNYKFSNKNYDLGDIIKIKKKSLNFLLIVETLLTIISQNIIKQDVYPLN